MYRKSLVLAMVFASLVSVASAELIGYWKLDGNAVDSSGHGNHGTIYGSVTPTADRSGNPNGAMAFASGSGDKIDVGNSPVFNLTGEMTLMAWVWLDSTISSNRNARIIAKMAGSGSRSWSLNIEKIWGGVVKPAALCIAPDGFNIVQIVDDEPLPVDEWVHVTGVYKPRQAMELYINGELAYSKTSGVPASQFSNNGYSVLIGNRHAAGDCGWKGYIDEVRIYNHALSQQEIKAVMGAYTAVGPDPKNGALHIDPKSILSWDAPASATNPIYDIYLGTDPNFADDTPVSAGQADTSYDPSPDLQFATTYYWRVDVNDNGQIYEGPVWSFTTAGLASNPIPADGAVIITLPDLRWEGDDAATSYDVYLGTSESAVADAGRLAGDINGDGPVDLRDIELLGEQWLISPPCGEDPIAELDGNGEVNFADFAVLAYDWLQEPDPAFKGNRSIEAFNPGKLEPYTTYYWRVDEVNNCEPGSPWKGDVWSFTIHAPDPKPRVIVSSDIGGSDPDDFQSMVHYLVYADLFDTEGLISSPPYGGRKSDILAVIDQYEQDYDNLRSHSPGFPSPEQLRSVTKQGAIYAAPPQGYSTATEGSNWIIERALADDPRPLWILVWGSITDVAQAIHDNPGIKSKIRVISVGSWNTAQDPYARNYLYLNHPDLWWIESNTTFRGMYIGGDQSGDLGNYTFVQQHVRGHGALGDFYYSKKIDIKMGDTPTVLYLMWGDPEVPTSEHWGGMFRAVPTHGPHYWTDLTDPQYREGSYNGAKTVNKWRENYLRDWQIRMDWAKEPASN